MRLLRLLLRLAGGLAALLIIALALLQTPPGKAWLARAAGALASAPGRPVAVTGLGGLIPLHMTVARLTVGDRDGTWLTLDDVTADLSLADLLRGRVRLRRLALRAAEVAHRPSLAGGGSAPPPVLVEQLTIGRLVLRPAVLGSGLAASVAGRLRVDGSAAQARLDIRRVDGAPGGLALDATLDRGVLALTATAEEPTGTLLAALLRRREPLPVAVRLAGSGPLDGWHGHLAAAAGPRVRLEAELGLADGVLTASGTASVAALLPAAWAALVGDDAGFALRLTVAQPLRLDALTLDLAAGRLTGDAVLGTDRAVAGHVAASLPRLAAVAPLAGLPLAGALRLRAAFAGTAARLDITALTAAASDLRTGNAVLDALLGSTPRLSAAAQWRGDGTLVINRLSLVGAALGLSGRGDVAVAARRIEAGFGFALPRLAALPGGMAGRLSGDARLTGPVDRLRVAAAVSGEGLAIAGTRVERLRLSALAPDLSQAAATIAGGLRIAGLDAQLAAAVARGPDDLVAVPRLHVAAAGATLDGNLQIGRISGLATGTLRLRAPDLARWSRLARRPLAGSVEATAQLAADPEQGVTLSATGDRLALDAGRSRAAAARLAVTVRLSRLRPRPAGTAQLSLSGLRLAGRALAEARLSLAGSAGAVVFSGDARGDGTALSFAGDAGFADDRVRLRLARLGGRLAGTAVRLDRPLSVTGAAGELAVSDLALRLGGGRVTGDFRRRGPQLSARFAAATLPLADLARLAGRPPLRGALSLSATLGGTLAAPHGHLSGEVRGLAAATPNRELAPLGLIATGDWNGRALALRGRITGLRGDTLQFDGALPLRLSPAPLALLLPADGRVALHLHGEGQLAGLAGLLPLGEDRLTGRYAVDAALAGTVAAPTASGRLRISGARYQNFASGAVLTGLDAEIAGDRDRLDLVSLTAGDGAGGRVTARGQIRLAAAAPAAELSARLTGFRIAALDEATGTATGSLDLTGPLSQPRIAGSLTIDRADLRIPESLPPSVARLAVVVVNGGTAAAVRHGGAPAFDLPLALDIAMPGRVFVRGRGLDSEWRGRLHIAGTTAAPRVTGRLEVVRGSYDALGKSFRLQSGAIAFPGDTLDPQLDILAEASAGDITARIRVTGSAAAPSLALTSTPALPQDEILSRVLFGQGIGQISAAQGVEIADAAAALAGGGPGLLERLRGGLGLDRLGLSQAQGLSSILNPTGAASPTAAAPAAAGVSAGKYVAPGVYVGVSQGLTGASSKVQVEVQLRPHLSVETDLGESGSSGVGLNYKFDY